MCGQINGNTFDCTVAPVPLRISSIEPVQHYQNLAEQKLEAWAEDPRPLRHLQKFSACTYMQGPADLYKWLGSMLNLEEVPENNQVYVLAIVMPRAIATQTGNSRCCWECRRSSSVETSAGLPYSSAQPASTRARPPKHQLARCLCCATPQHL